MITVIHDLEEEVFEQLNINADLVFSKQDKIGRCMGCFDCWLKNEGICKCRLHIPFFSNKEVILMLTNDKKVQNNTEIDDYVKSVKESNASFEKNIENIQLKKLVKVLQKENEKIPKAKDLVQFYKEILKDKDDEIRILKNEKNDLTNMINRIPKFIRKIFI